MHKDILIDNLKYCQQHQALEIFAYAILTNHMHLIGRRQEGDLTELLGRFKSYTSKKILSEIETNPQESRKEWLLYLFNHFAKTNTQYSNFHFWNYTNHPVLLHTNDVIN